MPRCSNTLVGILNVFVFLLSIPVLCTGIYLSLHGSTHCARLIDKLMISLGVFLVLVSIIGIIGFFFKKTCLLWFYLFLMFFVILFFLGFTLFAFIVSSEGSGQTIEDKAYKEYRLESYSKWLQNRVRNTKNWDNIRGCLLESKVCPQLEKDYGRDTVSSFDKRALTSIQSGCCKPSNDCDFTYVSPTNWNKTSSEPEEENSDCQVWDNDSKKLCYNCQACKAGFVQSLKDLLEIVALCNIGLLVFLIVIYAMGCTAIRNNKIQDMYGPSFHKI